MELQDLTQQLVAAHLRRAGLQAQKADTLSLPPLLQETLTELQASLEELRVADEELRTQNEELVLSKNLLEGERQRYQELFDFAPEAYLVTDMQGLVREANTAATALLSISARGLRGKPLASFVLPAGRMEFRQRLLEMAGPAAGIVRLPLTLTPRQDKPLAAQATVTRAFGHAGEQPTLLWVVRDLSERNEAERAHAALGQELAAREQAERQEVHLRTQSSLLEALLTAAPAGFAFVGMDGRFLRANEALARMLGIAASEFLGKSIAEVMGKESSRLLQPLLELAMRGQTGPDTEISCARSEGEACHLLVSHYAVQTDEAMLGIGLVVTDITARKESETALQSAYEREHKIAEVLQRSLLRSLPDASPAGLSVATFYEAALAEAQIGGDFFDMFTLDDELVALMVGDVSGKGLAAAASTAEMKYALRAFARETLNPEAALERLNNFMCEARVQGDWDENVFAALSLCILNPTTGEGLLALAGAEPALVRRASGEVETVEANGILLGIERGHAYTQTVVTLLPGDLLVMATDGITEARRGGEFLGVDGLSDLLAEAGMRETAQAVGETILQGVHRFVASPAGAGCLSDDCCLLVAQRQAIRPSRIGVGGPEEEKMTVAADAQAQE